MDDAGEVLAENQGQEQPAEVGQPAQSVTKDDIREAVADALADYAKTQEDAKGNAKSGEEVQMVMLDGSQYATIEGTCQWSIYLMLMGFLGESHARQGDESGGNRHSSGHNLRLSGLKHN